ncbi:MAG: peptidase [Cyanobacteriota bacterium]|nr:peptidase [Cyanobacteriota bacterium]
MAEASTAPRSLPLAARCRQAHAALAPFVLAPLALTAATGVAYRTLKDWAGWSRDQAHPLLTLHEGEWLKALFGPRAETLYVLLNGLGLLWMAATGAAMAWQRLRRWRAPRGGGGSPTG